MYAYIYIYIYIYTGHEMDQPANREQQLLIGAELTETRRVVISTANICTYTPTI